MDKKQFDLLWAEMLRREKGLPPIKLPAPQQPSKKADTNQK